MEAKKNLMTEKGLKELEDEREHLIVVRRKEVAEKLKEARAQGDLSENAEYDAAKDEQAEIEARIAELEEILKNAEVVFAEDGDEDKVNLGTTVTILNVDRNVEATYSIVGSTEANSLEKKISNESPIGKALIGATVGETVTVELPAGEAHFKVLSIER